MMSPAVSALAQTPDPVAPYRAATEALAERFQVSGAIDKDALAQAARGLEAVAKTANGEMHARALMQLGTVLRMSNDFQGAITAQTEAAREAESLGLKDLAFDAWIGVARANENGPRDHGAAAVALDRAVDAAGEQPSEKQRWGLTYYLADLEIGRGELEKGVIDALSAIRLARDPKDRFYSELDLADGLQKLVWSCDHHPLVDAKSSDDKDDAYGACRRAVAAARAAYQQAGNTAAKQGWLFLLNNYVHGFEGELEWRRWDIDMRAWDEKVTDACENRPLVEARPTKDRDDAYGACRRAIAAARAAGFNSREWQLMQREVGVLIDRFHPHSIRDVTARPAGQYFRETENALSSMPQLASLAESIAGENEAKTGRKTARDVFLLGMAKDIKDAPPEEAARYYAEAAAMLESERSGFFDPRRRGTVIEGAADIIPDLAFRLLALGREADAFAAFESIRARGLGELALAMASPDVTPDDRRWFADLLLIEAQESAIEHRIVAEIVASGRFDAQADRLETLDRLRAERQAKLNANAASRARFDVGNSTPAGTLDKLRAATAGTGVPVLLYLTTSEDVIAWYVGPDGSEVIAVVLPSSVLEGKVRSVTESSGGSFGRKPFDEATARELFLYLLGPFSARINSSSVHEIMIVPQGPLVGLPFEALVDPVRARRS
jgi:hypothetical protein